MYKKLNENEKKEFLKKHFDLWENDINSISILVYKNKKEYLINNGIIFVE